jgi:hypothetical protein
MSYYQGDFYRMSRSMGDPGFLSFLKKGIGAAVSFIPGIGRPAATAIEKIGGGGILRTGGAIIKRGVGQIVKHPVLSAAAGAGVALGAGALAGHELTGGMPTKGFHVSKKTGKVVRNRRMRVTNPRALRRAIRRANGFARLARRVLRFTSPRAPKGRAVFKHRRKARHA